MRRGRPPYFHWGMTMMNCKQGILAINKDPNVLLSGLCVLMPFYLPVLGAPCAWPVKIYRFNANYLMLHKMSMKYILWHAKLLGTCVLIVYVVSYNV